MVHRGSQDLALGKFRGSYRNLLLVNLLVLTENSTNLFRIQMHTEVGFKPLDRDIKFIRILFESSNGQFSYLNSI